MGPASTRMGGMLFAFPDVCKTQVATVTVPIPYPNTAQCPMANGATCSQSVTILNQPVLTQATIIPTSMGDQAGALGGVVSGVFGQQVAYKLGEPTVLVEGNPIVTVLSMTAHNGTNANAPAGSQLSPSQTAVIIL